MSKVSKAASKVASKVKTVNPNLKYNHHVGHEVKKVLKLKEMSYMDLANLINLSKNAAINKLNKPYYGNVYELIDVSIALQHDFISELLPIIKKQGVDIEFMPIQAENKMLRETVDRLEKEIERNHRIIDKFTKG